MEKKKDDIGKLYKEYFEGDTLLEEVFGGIFKNAMQGQTQENTNITAKEDTHQESVRQENTDQGNLPEDDSPGILSEILKELKEMNSNLKALVVRADTNKEETRKLREKIEELIEKIK